MSMCFDCQERIRRFEAIEECREEFSYLLLQKKNVTIIQERCQIACYVWTTLKLSCGALSLTYSMFFS